jgi:hypothetical protein
MRGLEMRTGASVSSRSLRSQGLALHVRRPTAAQTARLSQNSSQSEYYRQYETFGYYNAQKLLLIASSVERCHHICRLLRYC